MVRTTRAAIVIATMAYASPAVGAQEQRWAERAYLSAVAHFFEVPEAEIEILGHWDLPTDELPVVLFVAQRAGVSAEALVALRESGYGWTELAQRYRVGPQALHVPLIDPEAAGVLTPVYDRFRATPVAEWARIRLSSEEIVTLVNVRVLSVALGLSPDEIVRHAGVTETFVQLYAQLIR